MRATVERIVIVLPPLFRGSAAQLVFVELLRRNHFSLDGCGSFDFKVASLSEKEINGVVGGGLLFSQTSIATIIPIMAKA